MANIYVFNVCKVKDYRILWTVGILNSSARWLEIIIFSVLTWQWFGDATYAGSLFALRMIAISLTGLIFSLVSNHFSGQKIMFWTQAAVAACCLISSLCMNFEKEYGFYSLCILSLLSGALWSLDFSYRRRMLADTLSVDQVVSGISLDVVSSHATRFIGTLVGGIILTFFDNSTIFLILAATYLIACAMIVRVRDKALKSSRKLTLNEEISSVIQQAKKSIPILTVLLITPVFNIFALPYIALIPLIYIEKFNSAEFLTGLLTSSEGIGAVFGGLLISVFIKTKLVFVFALIIMTLLLTIYLGSISENIYLFTFLIICTGALTSAYSTMQSSIIYTTSQKKLRSATFSVLTISIGLGFIGGTNTSWIAQDSSVSDIAKTIAIQGFFSLALVCSVLILLKFKSDNQKN